MKLCIIVEDNIEELPTNMTDTSIVDMLTFVIAIFIALCITSCLYCCIKCCNNCEKKAKEEQHIAEIDKNLSKRENDWWNQSGGPPVNNGGQMVIPDDQLIP